MDLKLNETLHPNGVSSIDFEELVGIDSQKEELLNTLYMMFDSSIINEWHKKYHNGKLSFLKKVSSGLPVIILSGDVGCGKTALANAVATPLAKKIDSQIFCFETPSNIRGAGRVGEISNRITEAFEQIKGKLGKSSYGVLIIDEADDLATSREQNQAHHEDRAGLNVLIKQIDLITREGYKLIVILITNRLKVIDPAVIRRASCVIKFYRPNESARKVVFEYLFNGACLNDKDIKDLVEASEHEKTPYSFSDLIQKIGKQAIFKAVNENKPFSKEIYLEVLGTIEPSPMLD